MKEFVAFIVVVIALDIVCKACILGAGQVPKRTLGHVAFELVAFVAVAAWGLALLVRG